MEMEFDAWCRHALSHAQQLTQVSNAQVRLLSRTHGSRAEGRRTKDGLAYDLNQARRNLRNVDLLGRTEHFARDVSRFPALLATHGIAFEVGDTTPRNVTASDFGKSVEARLDALSQALSPETWAALQAANRQDLQLYEEVSARLDAEDVPDQPEAASDGTRSEADTVTVPSSASSRSS